MTREEIRDRLIDWLNAFKADPFSTGADKADRLLEILASADTHPKDGDVKQAPLVSGAVAATSGETPDLQPILPNKERPS